MSDASSDANETAEPDLLSQEVEPTLGNIAFWCSDFDAMRRFYSEIIGLPERAAGERPRKWVFYGDMTFSFSLNQAEIAPHDEGWTRCPRDPSIGDNWRPYITFYVPDLQATIARARQAGAPLHSDEPFSLGEGFGWSIEMKDPDGNAVAVTQR